MNLPHFIHESLDDILAEWERDCGAEHGASAPVGRRQHFGKVLRTVAEEMKRTQPAGAGRPANAPVFDVGQSHTSQLISDYASLRASVVRQWRARHGSPSEANLDELVYFNEAMDRSLAELTATFSPADAQPHGLFLGVLNHELRTSVASILMSAQVLTHRCAPGSPEGKAAQRILKSCGHLRESLDALSDFTQVPLGDHLQIERARADMGVLCKQALEAFARVDPQRRVHLSANGELGGAWDARRIRDAVGSLLDHAARFAPSGSTVSITADGRGADAVTVTVHGDGSPIDVETLRTVFDRRARVESDDPTYAGLGLGLFIVRKVVDAHGGSVGVDAAPGSGTTFTLVLPRHA